MSSVSIVSISQEVSDKAWELYDELQEFAGLEGRDTTVSLRDVFWEFVDGRIEEDSDSDDLKLCMGGLSLSLSGEYLGIIIIIIMISPTARLRL